MTYPTPNFDPTQDPDMAERLAMGTPFTATPAQAQGIYPSPADAMTPVPPLPGSPLAPPPEVGPDGSGPVPGLPSTGWVPPAPPPPPGAAPMPGELPPPILPSAPPGPPRLVTDSTQTSSTRSGIKETPELRAAAGDVKATVGEGKAAREAAISAEERAAAGGQDLASEAARLADRRQVAEEAHQRDVEAMQLRHDAADQAARKQADAARAAVKGFKFRDYWDGKSGGRRIASALSVAMGAFGAALTKTPNYALQILEKNMDDDHRGQVEKLQQLKDDEVMAKTGIADAREARTAALAAENIKYAGGLRVIASELDKAAARNTDKTYKDVVAARTAGMRALSAEKDQAGQQLLYQDALERAPKTSSTTVTSKKVADPGAAGGHGAGAGGTSLAAADAVAKLQSDIGSLDRVLGTIKAKPGAWNEFRNNSEAWKRAEAMSKVKGVDTLRALGQGLGAANVSEEQGLKSGEAKTVYKGMQEALTSIAKGYGGVITTGDREAAAAGLAVLNQNPAEAMRTLGQIRTNLENRMQQYGGIRGIAPGGAAQPAQGAPALPPGLPPGAVPAGKTKDGRNAYRLPDGKLVAG